MLGSHSNHVTSVKAHGFWKSQGMLTAAQSLLLPNNPKNLEFVGQYWYKLVHRLIRELLQNRKYHVIHTASKLDKLEELEEELTEDYNSHFERGSSLEDLLVH